MAMLMLTLGVGVVMGAVVLLATLAAGRAAYKWQCALGGAAWGFVLAWLVLTDCLPDGGVSRTLANAAFPLYFVGALAWPVGLAWHQPQWFRRWLFAQLLLILTLPPAFMLAVIGALCIMT